MRGKPVFYTPFFAENFALHYTREKCGFDKALFKTFFRWQEKTKHRAQTKEDNDSFSLTLGVVYSINTVDFSE